MPTNEASQPEALKVPESIARALDELELVVDTFDHTASGSVLKVLNNLTKPSSHRPDSALIKRLSRLHPIQQSQSCLGAIGVVKQRSECLFMRMHLGEFRGDGFDLSELFCLTIGEFLYRFEQGILAVLHGRFCRFCTDPFWQVSWLTSEGIARSIKFLIDQLHHMEAVSDDVSIGHQPTH